MVAVPKIDDLNRRLRRPGPEPIEAEFRIVEQTVSPAVVAQPPDPRIRELARKLSTVAEAMTWWDGPRTREHIKNGAKGAAIARHDRDRLARSLEAGWAWLEKHPDAEDFAQREAKWYRWMAE